MSTNDDKEPFVPVVIPEPARLSFEPMLDRLTVAAERIADALERMAAPTLREAVEAHDAFMASTAPMDTRCVGHIEGVSDGPGWRCTRFGVDTTLREDAQWWCDSCNARRLGNR